MLGVRPKYASQDSSCCRQVSPKGSAWHSLPFAVMDMIMHNLKGRGSLADVAVMRQVCKAWHAAFRQYPASLTWSTQNKDDLLGLCNMMPDMASLKVQSTSLDIDLQPVSVCTNLSFLRLDRTANLREQIADIPAVDLSLLPRNLKGLEVNGLTATWPALHSCSGLEMTSLKYLWPSSNTDDASELFKLLPCLPKLKARRDHSSTCNA